MSESWLCCCEYIGCVFLFYAFFRLFFVVGVVLFALWLCWLCACFLDFVIDII